MNYSLTTPELSIQITKTGIELCSIKSTKTGKEYIWQAEPSIWGSHAPILFPIIGALKDGNFIYKGVNYALPKHGFVRHSGKPKLIKRSEKSLHFQLVWDNETYKIYPFKFELDITYQVSNKTVSVIHKVTNLDDKPIYYSLGGHPAFNCPLNTDEEYEDYYLEFEQQETADTWLINKEGLLSGKTKPIIFNSNHLPLHKRLFDEDALIFKDLKSKSVSLVSKKSGSILTVAYEGFPYLGLWAKPSAPFICLEPWLGITDSSDSDQTFRTKEGIQELNVGSTDTKSYSIIID
ncbi:MAG: aldose 1-epimerase family protein [Balneola sp.]